MRDSAYWLAWMRVKGMGPIRLRALRAHFQSLAEAWEAPPETLKALRLPDPIWEHWLSLRRQLDPATLLAEADALGAWVLTLDDSDYPPLLRQIDDAPPVLYGRGDLRPEDQQAVAMVGTRRVSGYGKEMARQLAVGLAAQGITIISGLAHGIDTIAHQTALEQGGRTIAVLGCGIDIIYPPENRELAQQIIQQGAILSEFPPQTKPERGNFPFRNRVISGLSLGVVVVEAPEKSGALGTAHAAGEQGRDVFAVPGNANSPNSRGCNLLIQDGAKLVLESQDVLKELQLAHRTMQTRQAVQRAVPNNPLEQQLWDLLEIEALHVDDLTRQSGLPIHEINAVITLMELKGLVYQVAPMTYQRIKGA